MARRKPRKPAPKPSAEIKVRLGERIRVLRERAGLSQRDLARASGISGVFMGTVERGEKSSSIETVEKVAAGLGISMSELLDVGASPGRDDHADKLARRVAALARGASPSKLARFERIAKAFFEPDERSDLRDA